MGYSVSAFFKKAVVAQAAVDPGSVRRNSYDAPMKTTYIFGAILICSIAGAVIPGRAVKNAFLLLSGALSIYGLARILG